MTARRPTEIDANEAYSEKNRLDVLATIEIERAMKRAGVSVEDAARFLGCAPSRVQKILDGESEMTLGRLAEFGLACGVWFDIRIVRAAARRVARPAKAKRGKGTKR